MKLLFLFGDTAVGKMTVGQELMKITDLRLFHNHMTIEPVLEIFGTFNGTVIEKMRRVIFEEYAKSNNYGLIFTFIWAFNDKTDWENVENVKKIFETYGTEFYYAELVAPQEIRLQRNATENRLKNKPSKRNLEFSNQLLIYDDERYRTVSTAGEIPFENYIKIDNSNLPPEEAARMIKEKFSL